MPKFSYKAKQGPKKMIEGIIDAESVDGAVRKIIQSGFTPIDVKGEEDHHSRKASKTASRFLRLSRHVPMNEVMIFTRQMGDLIDAGVPILQALTIVERQVRHPKFKGIITALSSYVKDGGRFSDALAQHPQVFSKLYMNMVKSGEVGGHLNTVMLRLAEFIEKDQETVSRIKSSLMYPALILVVGSLTIFVLMTWVIPRITVIFEDIDSALPLPTLILLGISSFLSKFWWLVLGLILMAVVYLRRIYETPQGRISIDGFMLKIPLWGEMLKGAELGRFARTLGTLLDNGVVIVTAIESVRLVIENAVLQEEIGKISEEVINGASLTNAIKGKQFFSDAAASMISVGEASGQIHDGLYKLASYYERQTERFVKGVLSMIEPVLILIMGSIVGFVVIAMLLPIFRMNLMIQ